MNQFLDANKLITKTLKRYIQNLKFLIKKKQSKNKNKNKNKIKKTKTTRLDCVIAMTRTLPAYMTSVDL